jgi:hypothetical protein
LQNYQILLCKYARVASVLRRAWRQPMVLGGHGSTLGPQRALQTSGALEATTSPASYVITTNAMPIPPPPGTLAAAFSIRHFTRRQIADQHKGLSLGVCMPVSHVADEALDRTGTAGNAAHPANGATWLVDILESVNC